MDSGAVELQGALNFLDYLVIIAYIIALLALGFWVSFKEDRSEDLFLAGRSLKWPNIGLSIFGTNVSPSMMISSAGVAYASGMVASNMEWLAWIFLLMLGMIFLPHYLNTKVSTMPQFLNKRFGESSRIFLSYYTILSTLALWLGGTLYAGGLLTSQLLGWPIWMSVGFLLIIATSFTITGGLAAVVITDSFQSILMIVASTILAIIGLYHIGSIGELFNSVPKDYWHLLRPASDPKWPWYAVLLGYPVGGIWFWCTDQTIVQRALGGKNLREGQMGTVFAGFLKVVVPFIFFVPGIMCKVLHPNLESPDMAYTTMVTQYLPSGMVGLVVAVLIAALISTVDSGLNSLSTVFTLDIYCKHWKPDSTPKEQTRIGRIVTFAGALIAFGLAMGISAMPSTTLFEKLLKIIQFLAPPLASVFIVGVLWQGATSKASILTLTLGGIVSILIGLLHMFEVEFVAQYHFMFLSFLIFAGLIIFMVIVSFFTKDGTGKSFPTLLQASQNLGAASKEVWRYWIALAVIMFIIYILFNPTGIL